jgi:hypothetical protein
MKKPGQSVYNRSVTRVARDNLGENSLRAFPPDVFRHLTTACPTCRIAILHRIFTIESSPIDRSSPNQEGRNMKGRKITNEEQGCVSNCIFQHWGDPDSPEAPETRDENYEKCLEDCRICG